METIYKPVVHTEPYCLVNQKYVQKCCKKAQEGRNGDLKVSYSLAECFKKLI